MSSESNPKTASVTLQVVQVNRTSYEPHFHVFTALVCSHKGGKKRARDTCETFFGYLPCYSPGIEYQVTVDEQNHIITRDGWRRVRYWLTEEFVSSTLQKRAGWKPAPLERLLERFKKPKCKEEHLADLEDLTNVRGTPEALLLFKRHFWSDLWFDLSVLKSGGHNLYSPRILERNAAAINSWQAKMDEDLVGSLLNYTIPVPRLEYESLVQLLNKQKERAAKGTLTKEDKEYEAKAKRADEMEHILTGRVTNPKAQELVYPPVPKHGYEALSPSCSYAYQLRALVEKTLRHSGDTAFRLKIEQKNVKELMIERQILLQVGEDIWTLPSNVHDASCINTFLDAFYSENQVSPMTIEQALECRSCLILTKGHNAFEVYRKLLDGQDEEGIRFLCPNMETAKEFHKQTDNYVYPQAGGIQIGGPKVLIFCFAQGFSLSSMASELGRYIHKDKEQWPRKVFFFGDPNMAGSANNGGPFQELIDMKRIPIFEFGWQCSGSEDFYPEHIKTFISSLDFTKDSFQIPWTEDVQMCSPDRFPGLYAELHKGSPDAYHILCETFTKIRELEKELRTKPPYGLRVHDKVWVPARQEIDWVSVAWPLDINKQKWEEARNLAMMNKIGHSVELHGAASSDHRECCGEQMPGRHFFARHEMEWANIQTFKDNNIPKRSHIVLFLTEHTRKKHIYTAACMTTSKLTLVGTFAGLDSILQTTGVQRKAFSLIGYTLDPSKRRQVV